MPIIQISENVTILSIPPNSTLAEYEAELFHLFEEGFPKKVVLENMSGLSLWALDDIKAHFKRVQKYASELSPDHAVAIVAAAPIDFGHGKMAQGNLAQIFPCRIEVFYDRDTALAWLLSPSEELSET